MRHLTAIELVDLLDGTLAPDRARHAESCPVCAGQLEQLREAVAGVPRDLPEPSPLFWEHFSAQVRDGIADTRPDRTGWRRWLPTRPATVLATCAALLLAVLAGPLLLERRPRPVDDADTVADVRPDAGDPATDAAWDAVRAAAENVAWEDAQDAGLVPAAGAADQAILGLTERERRELMSLLEEEVKRSGA